MSKKSIKQQFIYEIEKKILSGEWKVGDKLPTERELVEEYNTSRTVVNAGLAELAQKGFLNINPRQWTKVADYKKDGKLEVLYSIFRYNGDDINMAFLQSILDARRVIEVESIKEACINADKEDIKNLEEIIEGENYKLTLDERVNLDFKFHHMLCVASKNGVYPLIMNSFEPIAKKYLRVFYSLIDESYKINIEHKDIVNAIKSRSKDKAVELLNLLLTEGEEVIRLYGGKKDE